MLSTSADKRHLETADGTLFFYLADTSWASFGNVPLELWEPYLRYRVSLEATRAVCPDLLYTMHIGGRRVLDERLIDGIDFYMYQSGHQGNSQTSSHTLARQFAELPRKPILNAEPCYEGHGRMGVEDRNRFSAFDVRRATWQSLLAGASVGITYGAQGIWSGQVKGMHLMAEKRKFEAFDWEFAYGLQGAWDVGYVKWIYESYKLVAAEPVDLARNAVVPEDTEVLAAADPDRTRIVAYAPYTTSLEVDLDLSGYTCSCIDLEDRRSWNPTIHTGEKSRVECPQFNHDMLFLAIEQ